VVQDHEQIKPCVARVIIALASITVEWLRRTKPTQLNLSLPEVSDHERSWLRKTDPIALMVPSSTRSCIVFDPPKKRGEANETT
jgi:hypothetical protein